MKRSGLNNLKELFSFPIKCLLRIYDSIELWHIRYGSNGYYKILAEYVAPIYAIGEYPYVLEYHYLKSSK